jgi:hypothetical protein
MCAVKSTVHLSGADSAIIRGMIERGDRQHDIASLFGQNGGRIAEISTQESFPGIAAISDNLPPPGPYIFWGTMEGGKKALEEARERIRTINEWLDDQIANS